MKRFERVERAMAGHVEKKAAPGFVTAISLKGEAEITAVGRYAFDDPRPLQKDAIFRISSMTKPIAAVVAMMLVEECVLRLDEPVDRFLPELADRKVLADVRGPLTEVGPACRSITLRDLLTFQCGFGMLPGVKDAPILAAFEQSGIRLGMPVPRTSLDIDTWMKKLGELPLMVQPGDRFLYNAPFDVLGVLLSRASGKSLESLMRERLFSPLGMKDTAFHVPTDKRDRLTTSYVATKNEPRLLDPAKGSEWETPPPFPSAAAGLVSTAQDLLAFTDLLLGKHPELLARTSLAAMQVDSLSDEQRAKSAFFPGFFDSRGWGLGVCLVTKRSSPSASVGAFGWDGGLGTSMWVDPSEGLAGIHLSQRSAFPLLSEPQLDFWTSVYASLR